MFTRLDAERNGKIVKRAVHERRLSEESFSAIMEHMDSYVGLPAKRLAHIVRRYSHHRSMKDIGNFYMRFEITIVIILLMAVAEDKPNIRIYGNKS